MFYVDWDDMKAEINFREHGVTFEEASEVFLDPLRLEDENLEFEGEQRYQVIGAVYVGAILHVTFVDYTVGPDLIARIISARKATALEREAYGEDH